MSKSANTAKVLAQMAKEKAEREAAEERTRVALARKAAREAEENAPTKCVFSGRMYPRKEMIATPIGLAHRSVPGIAEAYGWGSCLPCRRGMALDQDIIDFCAKYAERNGKKGLHMWAAEQIIRDRMEAEKAAGAQGSPLPEGISPSPSGPKGPTMNELRARALRLKVDISHLGVKRNAIRDLLDQYESLSTVATPTPVIATENPPAPTPEPEPEVDVVETVDSPPKKPRAPWSSELPNMAELREWAANIKLDISHLGIKRKEIYTTLCQHDPKKKGKSTSEDATTPTTDTSTPTTDTPTPTDDVEDTLPPVAEEPLLRGRVSLKGGKMLSITFASEEAIPVKSWGGALTTAVERTLARHGSFLEKVTMNWFIGTEPRKYWKKLSNGEYIFDFIDGTALLVRLEKVAPILGEDITITYRTAEGTTHSHMFPA